jgi:hypothetical protein
VIGDGVGAGRVHREERPAAALDQVRGREPRAGRGRGRRLARREPLERGGRRRLVQTGDRELGERVPEWEREAGGRRSSEMKRQSMCATRRAS